MSYSAGTFSLLTVYNPVVTKTAISVDWANNTLSDIATGLSTALLKDGTQAATASIPFAQGISVGTNWVIDASGNLAVTTNKFVVTASSGNTTIGGATTLTSAGPHAIGGATNANVALYYQGTLSPSGTGYGIYNIITINGIANADAYGFFNSPVLVEASAGTHAELFGAKFALNITNAAAATTNAATVAISGFTAGAGTTNAASLKITSAPSGATNNYALWAVGGGESRFDGQLTSTIGNNTLIFTSASATTGYQYIDINNTGARLRFGIESSTGAGLASGTTAYATVIGTNNSTPLQLIINGALAATLSTAGTLKIAGTAVRGTTEGTNHFDIFDGTAPVGTLSNGISLYSTAGELRVMDAAGNATLLSPHDKKTNEWVFDSVESTTGRRLHIRVEQLLKLVNDRFGADLIEETFNSEG